MRKLRNGKYEVTKQEYYTRPDGYFVTYLAKDGKIKINGTIDGITMYPTEEEAHKRGIELTI